MLRHRSSRCRWAISVSWRMPKLTHSTWWSWNRTTRSATSWSAIWLIHPISTMPTAIISRPQSISPSRVRCSAHSRQILKTRIGNPPKNLYPIYWTKRNTLPTTEICSCTSPKFTAFYHLPRDRGWNRGLTYVMSSGGRQVPTSNRTAGKCHFWKTVEQVRHRVNINWQKQWVRFLSGRARS